MNSKVIVFHPLIAPYRLDLFNDMATQWNASIYLVFRKYWRFKNYDRDIRSKFKFTPHYIYTEKKEKRTEYSPLPYWKILHREKPNYVFVSEFGPSTIFITFCDDSQDMIVHTTYKHKIARRVLSIFMDNIILSSPIVANWFKENFKKGVFFPIIRDDEIARANLYKSHINEYSKSLANQISANGKNIFLFVGRLAPEKNIKTLINAFQKTAEKEDLLLIVGNGSLEKEFRKYILSENIKNILLLGRREGNELAAIYNIADIFILPSLHECFGAVTNEALIYGCFSIISNKAGSSCLIKEGENGFTFTPESEEELCEAIIKSKHKIKHTNNYQPKPILMKASYKELFNNLTQKIFNEK